MACWVRGDEIGYKLLIEMVLGVHTIKDSFELYKLRERRFAHHIKNLIASVLGSHLETSRYMETNQFLIILGIGFVNLRVATTMHRQVIAHAAANERLFNLL